MPGLKWGNEKELLFLSTKVDDFSRVHSCGKPRVRNPAKVAFLQDLYDQFDKLFPGRIESMDLPQIGTGGSDAERKEATIDRLKNWFHNALRNPIRSELGTKRLLDINSNGARCRKRTEQSVNAYYRLYKSELQPEIEKDFAQQTDNVSQLTHRNRYLAQRLKKAPEEVKKVVEESRLKAGDVEQQKIVWADADTASEEEIQRRNEALQLNEDIVAAIRTMDRVTDEINRVTGWSATVVMGGPDPKRGGGIHVVALNKGRTLPSDGERQFEGYFMGWQQLLEQFTDFCTNSTTLDQRERISLSNAFETTKVDSGTGAANHVQKSGNPELEPENPTKPESDTTPNGDIASPTVEPSPTALLIEIETSDDEPLRSLSPLQATPSIVPIDPRLTESQSSKSIDHGLIGSGPPMKTNGESRHIANENSKPAQTATPEAATLYQNAPHGIPDLPPLTPLKIKKTKPRAPLAAVDSNRRRSVRNSEPAVTKGPLIPSSGKWIIDAVNYLRDAFRGFAGSDELIEELQRFEEFTGYQNCKLAKNKLCTERQPEAITSWLSGVQDFYKIPNSVHPVSKYLNDLFIWYHHLQPPSRGLKWDLNSTLHPPVQPVYHLPEDTGEWSQLRKGGSNGIFRLILALSWTPIYTNTREEKLMVEAMVTDLIWVLKVLSNAVYFKSINTEEQMKILKAGLNSKRKRGDESGPAYKKKKV